MFCDLTHRAFSFRVILRSNSDTAVVVVISVEKYCIVYLKMVTQLLRASEAMHEILSMQVLFDCRVCKERFAVFYPAYELSEEVATCLEILRSGKCGLAVCNVQVSFWDDMLFTLEHHEDLAAHHYGVCEFCQIDMNLQFLDQEGVLGDKIINHMRFVENHMDPCFRFPYDDLQELFDGASMLGGMLVAWEHMQIHCVLCTATGLQNFYRNVIVFPQDLSVFISQHDLGRGYCVTDRVTSSRCPGEELNRRPLKFWDLAVVKLKEKPAHTADGDIVYAAELLAVKLDGSFFIAV